MIEDDDVDSVHINPSNHSDDDAGHNSDDGIETQPTPEATPGQAQRGVCGIMTVNENNISSVLKCSNFK